VARRTRCLSVRSSSGGGQAVQAALQLARGQRRGQPRARLPAQAQHERARAGLARQRGVGVALGIHPREIAAAPVGDQREQRAQQPCLAGAQVLRADAPRRRRTRGIAARKLHAHSSVSNAVSVGTAASES
jgi:hypothetical protein